ncbi:colicin immunity domain-containing protein [Streptomyces sp. NBC_00690]|uniref:colicin immunity domain-containing protein n=1 Tax=Streptomyces sp. NBC_00690 TaxID=2975808 RepID=UPI002E2972DE|nr:colicin immunity domain-containing protein [Streptomyces sp. NBC_00690]
MVTGESFLNGDEGSFSEVLSSRGEFPEDWLSRGSKSIVPVAAGKQMDQALLQRIVKGCQSQRVDDILIAAVEEGLIKRPRRLSGLGSAAVSLEGGSPPILLAPSDLSGAILFPQPGYALVAGTSQFLLGAAPEGIDAGRARFARYARAAGRKYPALQGVAKSLPVRHFAWSRVKDLPAGTSAYRQVELMRAFVAGNSTASDFARAWLDARRLSQNSGERLRAPIVTALDHVFSLLEDFAIDPTLQEPGDLTDSELRQGVHDLMEQSKAFE